MKFGIKIALAPIVFIGGTVGGLFKGIGKSVGAVGDTIQHTLSGGAESVANLFDDENDNKKNK